MKLTFGVRLAYIVLAVLAFETQASVIAVTRDGNAQGPSVVMIPGLATSATV